MNGWPLLWTFSEVAELLWIVIGAAGGGYLGWSLRRLWWLGLGLVGGGIVFIGVPAAAFIVGGWLPVLPASIAFTGSMITVALYRSYSVQSSHLYSAPTIMMTSLTNPLEKKDD